MKLTSKTLITELTFKRGKKYISSSKKIFIYGDSLTWGYNPANGTRFPYEETWPGVIQKLLSDNYIVITEALAGRTTAYI